MRVMTGFAACVLWIVFIVLIPFEARAAQSFKLDGNFVEWQGRAHLGDGQGDGREHDDFKALSWGTNENEQKLYFMVERYAPANAASGLTCRLYFDINSNGSYEDAIDKFAEVVYNPDQEDGGSVTVQLYSVSGSSLGTYRGNWGEGRKDGGRRFEFALPMAELDIYPAQPVRFYLSGAGINADRLPNREDNMWAPFPVAVRSRLGIAAGFFIWSIFLVFFRCHRVWVFYYIWGAVGFTFILILLLRGSFVEYHLEHQAGIILHSLLNVFDIKTYVFDKAPGTLLVLIEIDNTWSTVDVDIESSGLLEMCIFLGLLLFYPAYSPIKKIMFSLAGIASIYAINLMRLIVVITFVHWGGRNMIFIAHTLIGRLVFFILIVALYWHVFTMPSLKKARENVENG